MTTRAISHETAELDFYRSVFELNPQPMWICDARITRFLLVNEAAVNQYGYSRNEFQSMRVDAVFPDENVDEFLGCRRNAHGSPNRLASGLFRQKTKRGQTFHVEIRTSSISYDGHD